ncbi:DUF6221 family protein [Mumia sp. DW29H23]|uniref:DUF6221 family protein n=1 Tax=Mumia sp. DW29H23 TaxID=3421241 RepID=UPI003D68D189
MDVRTHAIADFLLARIAEEELGARAAVLASPSWNVTYTTSLEHGGYPADAGDTYRDVRDGEGDLVVEATPSAPTSHTAAHVAQWDPRHVLETCEARRRIVTHYLALSQAEDDLRADPESQIPENITHTAGGVAGLDLALHALVQPYRDHPGFNDDWATDGLRGFR